MVTSPVHKEFSTPFPPWAAEKTHPWTFPDSLVRVRQVNQGSNGQIDFRLSQTTGACLRQLHKIILRLAGPERDKYFAWAPAGTGPSCFLYDIRNQSLSSRIRDVLPDQGHPTM